MGIWEVRTANRPGSQSENSQSTNGFIAPVQCLGNPLCVLEPGHVLRTEDGSRSVSLGPRAHGGSEGMEILDLNSFEPWNWTLVLNKAPNVVAASAVSFADVTKI